MKRIVLTGAECTGKSTLAHALSKHYGEPSTDEFVREYVDQLDRELKPEDLEPIFRGQLAIEEEGLQKADQLIFHDTNLLSSIIYAEHYFGASYEWVNETLLERDYTLYLLCTAQGIDWQEDLGQRDSPRARTELQTKFQERLLALKLPYVELSGGASDRLKQAIKLIDETLKA